MAVYESNEAIFLHARSVKTLGQQRCVPLLLHLLHGRNRRGFHKQHTDHALFYLKSWSLLAVKEKKNNGAPCCGLILGGSSATEEVPSSVSMLFYFCARQVKGCLRPGKA